MCFLTTLSRNLANMDTCVTFCSANFSDVACLICWVCGMKHLSHSFQFSIEDFTISNYVMCVGVDVG
jgi:hypothetical protein